MQKLIAALAAVLVTGVAGYSVASSGAQEARKLRAVQVETRDAEEIELVLLDDDVVQLEPRWRTDLVQVRETAPRNQQAGTWQIVMAGESAILLNTASGETFSLAKGDDGPHWKPIPRPMGMDAPNMPRLREGAPKTDREETERMLDELRQKLRKTEGDGRERIKKQIEELEKVLEKANEKRDGDKEPAKREKEKADKEPDKKDYDDSLKDLEEKIGALKEKYENSDSVKEREKLQRAIDELKEKADALRKERKDR